MARFLLIASAAPMLLGCAHLDFTPAGDVPQRPARAASDVKLYFDLDEPKCHYRVVGMYQASRGATNDMQIEPIREDAAKRGFDGLLGIACAAPGTVGSDEGRCRAKGYVCE